MGRFIKTTVGALIVANVAMFVLLKVLVAVMGINAAEWLALTPVPWPFVWTPLTYMFTNSDILDLLFNCLWLWLFSRMVMEVASPRQLLTSYIIGGLCGGLLFMASCALGLCSGMLFGASAAVLATVCFAAMRVPYMRLNLMFFGPVSFKWIAIIASALSLLPLIGGATGSGIAHLGGIIGGVAYAMFMRIRRPRFHIVRPDEKKTLDELLDKVRRSGYSSLNQSERKQLLDYSNKL